MSDTNHSSDASTGTEGNAMENIKNLANTVRSTTNSKSEMTRLSANFSPGRFDVICARGKKALQHVGNVNFRRMIESNLEPYSRANTKPLKSALVTSIVNAVRQASPEGGFVKEVDGAWYEVGDHIAREKIGQSFRDALHTQYRSSTRAKLIRKKIIEGKPVDNMKPVERSAPNGLENKGADSPKQQLEKRALSSQFPKRSSDSFPQRSLEEMHYRNEREEITSRYQGPSTKILPARVVAKNLQNPQPRPMHTPSDATPHSSYPALDSPQMSRQGGLAAGSSDQQQQDINAALLNLLSLHRTGGPPGASQQQQQSINPSFMHMPYNQNGMLPQVNGQQLLQGANRPVIIVVLPSGPRS